MFRRQLISCSLMLTVMIAVQVGSVSSAVASCGDYLVHESSQLFAYSSATTDNDLLPSRSWPTPNLPCRDPGCQKGPPAEPAMPVPAQISTVAREWLENLPSTLIVLTAERTCFDRDAGDRPIPGYLLSIEHPPRAAS